MKLDKNELKKTILFVSKIGGELKLRGLSINGISTPEKCYNLYYGGGSVTSITIWKCYENYDSKLNHVEITDENIDQIVDEVYSCLSSNINDIIEKALINIGESGEFETLKYFDRDIELFNKFKEEVKRLSDEKI